MNRNSYLDGELIKKQILAAIQAMSAENSLLQNLLMYYFEIYNDVTLSGVTADNIRTAAYIYVYLISVNIQVNEKDIEDLRKAYDIIPNEHFDGDFLWTRRDEVVKEREQNLINLEKAIEGSESKSPTILIITVCMTSIQTARVKESAQMMNINCLNI